MRTNPRLKKRCAWLETIERDVEMVFMYRRIFSETKDIVEKNERIDLSNPFFSLFSITYMDSSVMGIRRQLKIDPKSISLARLLTEIAHHPELVTRSDHYELYDKHADRFPLRIIERLRRQTFDEFALPDSPTISAEIVSRDLKTLQETCKRAEIFADRRIAHLDKRKPPVDLNLEIIFKALDTLETLIKRYHLLFFAEEIELTPGLPCPISDVFREPWVKSSSE